MYQTKKINNKLYLIKDNEQIGEISPDALYYVKEGQEFNEDEVYLFFYDPNDPSWTADYHNNPHQELFGYGFKVRAEIKGPCGHFH